MKQLLLCLVTLVLAASFTGKTPASPETIDGVINEFYSCLDVPAGSQIDSVRFTNLFHKNAPLDAVFPKRNDSTAMVLYSFSVPEYLKIMKGNTKAHSFREWETGRKVMQYQHLACVYSSYQFHHISLKGDTASESGVNVFHLANDGKRWWITYCNYEAGKGTVSADAIKIN